MNWKVLCLIAGLTLTASLSACSKSTPDSQNQVAPSTAPAAESATPEAMKKGNAMKKGDAMNKGDTMKKGDAMNKGDTMKKGDAMNKGDTMKKEPTATKSP